MTRTGRSFAQLRERATQINIACKAKWIDFLGRRDKYQIYAECFEQMQITIQVTGIATQILMRTKLCRINKNTHNKNLVFSASLLAQRKVSCMKIPHRRH